MYTAEQFVLEWNTYAPKGRDLGAPEGYSEEEIRSFEEQLGQSLPLAYREFLKAMGRTTMTAFSGYGTDIEEPEEDLEACREIAIELTGRDPFPEDAFVFLSRDEICDYFRLSDPSPNPRTWRWKWTQEDGERHFETEGVWWLPNLVLSEYKKGNYEFTV